MDVLEGVIFKCPLLEVLQVCPPSVPVKKIIHLRVG